MSVENMRKLGWTEAEIADVIECDKKIDKGEKLFELSTDQKVVEKKMKNIGSKAPTTYKFQKRERKADDDKAFLMFLIQDAIIKSPNVADFEMANKERECVFTYCGRKFKIVLSAPRS